jgi:hypothetical protein
MASPLLLTYDNAPTSTTEFFVKTLNANGWDYTMIGAGERWEGFMTKIKGYLNYLNSMDEERIVIISDARDVVCVRSPKAFIKGFNSFKSDMVVSMELLCDGKFDKIDISDYVPNLKSQCIPLNKYWKHHGVSTLPIRKYVNSGLMAGKVKALKQCLKWLINNNYTDDQFAVGNYMNMFPDRIAVDIDAILLHSSTFAVNSGIQSIHIQKHDSPTFAELFGRGAFFLHLPGLHIKGQSIIYKYVCTMIEAGASDTELRKPYKFNEPEWDEIF